MEFGRSARKHFLLSRDYVNVNHGSYGSIPRTIHQHQIALLYQVEENPDRWFRLDSGPIWESCCDLAADRILNTPKERDCVVLVKNTSTGVSSVVRSVLLDHRDQDRRFIGWRRWFQHRMVSLFPWTRWFPISLRGRPRILCYSTSYVQVKEMLNYLSRCNVNVEIVRVEFDRTHFDAKWIVSETERVVRHYGGRFDLAIVDAIASVPCFVLPFQELTRMFQSYGNSYISENGIDSVWLGIPVLVDAAHAAGQIPIRLDTDSFRPDFFITNIHKWMYAARGCAVLYIDRRWHEYMVPTVVSAGYHNGQGSLRDRFRWVGTDDYTPLLTLEKAIEWRSEICGGEERIQSYCKQLSKQASQLLARDLQTEVMLSDQPDLMAPCLFNIRLPTLSGVEQEQNLYGNLGTIMLNRFSSYIVSFRFAQEWWIRLSVQIYNDLSDYEHISKSLRLLIEEVKGQIAH